VNRKKKIKEIIDNLGSEKITILVDNIGCHDYEIKNVMSIIESLLKREVLIFDGEKSLFFKKTGLMVWEKP